MFIPSKMFCCWAAIDFRLLEKRMSALRRSSFTHTHSNSILDALKRSWLVAVRCSQVEEILFHATHTAVYRHVVIVEDNQQVVVGG